jgi:hypothetical protein
VGGPLFFSYLRNKLKVLILLFPLKRREKIIVFKRMVTKECFALYGDLIALEIDVFLFFLLSNQGQNKSVTHSLCSGSISKKAKPRYLLQALCAQFSSHNLFFRLKLDHETSNKVRRPA